jgi:hypothetical protein
MDWERSDITSAPIFNFALYQGVFWTAKSTPLKTNIEIRNISIHLLPGSRGANLARSGSNMKAFV